MNVAAPASPTATAVAATASPPDAVRRPAPEVCIVVPTFNERANVPILVERLAKTLAGCDWEVLFVDDNSPDGTAAVARAIGETDSRVRCMRRIGRRGLAGACLEGMLASQARYVAVMDGDLQHDETLLVTMLDRLRTGGADGEGFDLAVASRYLSGGSAAGLSSPQRARLSSWGNLFVRRVLGVPLSDPMSGFFMIRRDAFEALAPALSTQGFKLLLDILVTAGGRLRIVELPSTFRQRVHGESKLDSKIALDFAALVTAKLTHDAVSVRFLLYCLVGLTGLGIHLTTLFVLTQSTALSFSVAQAAATIAAIAWNFVLNNLFTYHDQRLTGWRFLTGLLRFQVICAIGAISNVGIATWIYDYDSVWWIAGLGGALIGTVWNFAVSAAFVWRQQ
ncbi:MAG TPA: glycosyltransferase family 2 protein [Xanthobacteraceae bacterium]|nr:glycosyltransferase family 2 protein [Xanthobacteraceae bacterium]